MNPSAALSINGVAFEWANYAYLLRNNLLPIFFLGKTSTYADPIDYVIPIVKTTGTDAGRIGLAGSAGEGGIMWDSATVDGWIDAANYTLCYNLYQFVQEYSEGHC